MPCLGYQNLKLGRDIGKTYFFLPLEVVEWRLFLGARRGRAEAAIRQIKGTCSYVKPQIPQAIFPTAPAKNCTADADGGGFEGLRASFIISLSFGGGGGVLSIKRSIWPINHLVNQIEGHVIITHHKSPEFVASESPDAHLPLGSDARPHANSIVGMVMAVVRWFGSAVVKCAHSFEKVRYYPT